MKKIFLMAIVVMALTVGISSVSAHVSVKPNQVGIGVYQVFITGVPSEKDFATVGLRIVVPAGLTSVSPNVKPGWTIELKKEGTGEAAMVTEIIWKGGRVPAHFRDEFAFSAKVPATPSTLMWRAYQTYEDGSIVSWDNDPKGPQPMTAEGKSDFSKMGPYSVTNIVDDLAAPKKSYLTTENISLALSILALLMSLVAISSRRRR